MFVPYEAVENKKDTKEVKNFIRENGLILEEQGNRKNIYLEKYPNNCIFGNYKNFNILENNNSILILEIYDKENKKNILFFNKFKGINEKKINKLDRIVENGEWKNTIIKKIDIVYKLYSDKNIKNINSTYTEGESNTIGSSTGNYENKEDKKIYKKYFKKGIKEKLFDLLK